MNQNELTDALLSLRDESYRQMQLRILPNVAPETVIGVRTPQLRRLAKEMTDGEDFLQMLPHRYFEENQIHALLLGGEKDFSKAVAHVEAFLPYVDNWATCDQLRPRVFARHRDALLPCIRRWLTSDQPYTLRFGMEMLMVHYLDDAFDPALPELVASVKTDHYYVRMMAAWYFATALAKQYDAVLPYITQYRLDPWTHNKTIQKAVESFRIPTERKNVLRVYRIKG
ncbi:MAG: DNA alkylation repair protein [Firmicutes bacterium]|nr:DNA alkylation repair protein [Bacillota bacterium]